MNKTMLNNDQRTRERYDSPVSQVRCNGCANKIRTKLLERDEGAEIQVDIEHQHLQVDSSIPHAEINSILDELGYLPKHEGSNEGNQQEPSEPMPDDASYKEPITRIPSTLEFDVALEGVTCASCVNTIEKTLNNVSEISSFEINFANRTAHIAASLSTNEIIKRIEEAGYGASIIETQDDLSDEQVQRDAREYRLKVRNSKLGLGIGIPLMLYGLLGGEMSISSPISQFAWGGVGILTLLILCSAGRGYFSGAWKAFKKRNANMDTLIA